MQADRQGMAAGEAPCCSHIGRVVLPDSHPVGAGESHCGSRIGRVFSADSHPVAAGEAGADARGGRAVGPPSAAAVHRASPSSLVPGRLPAQRRRIEDHPPYPPNIPASCPCNFAMDGSMCSPRRCMAESIASRGGTVAISLREMSGQLPQIASAIEDHASHLPS